MSTFNTPVNWAGCSAEQRAALLMRPAISASDSITRTVSGDPRQREGQR
jgi:histidinol dehydrogenase